MTEQLIKDVLSIVVAQTCQSVGFDSIHSTAHEVLTDILKRFLETVGTSTHNASEQCGSSVVCLRDVEHAFELMQITRNELIDYVQQMEMVSFQHNVGKFPVPKKSNLQFPVVPSSNSLDYIYPYFPLLVKTVPETGVVIDSELGDSFKDHTGTSAIAGKLMSSDDDQGSYSSAYSANEDPYKEFPEDSTAEVKADEPLWVKQHAAKLEIENSKKYSTIPETMTPDFNDAVSMNDASASIESALLKREYSWDSSLFQRSKASSYNKDSIPTNQLKSDFTESSTKSNKNIKSDESIMSRIEEVDKLLHDPIFKKDLEQSKSQLIKSPVSIATPDDDGNLKSESALSSCTFASRKSMDDAIDAVINRASRKAEEKELMKFSHLIEHSSSSDEDVDIVVSHKAEEMLQLERRGFHKSLDEESPVRPPLTPSPSMNCPTDDLNFSTAETLKSRSETTECLADPTSSSKAWNSSHRKTEHSAELDYSQPSKRLKTSTKERKKLKYSKSKQKNLSSAVDEVKSIFTSAVRTEKSGKSVDKLILKKSKGGETKVVKVVKEKDTISLFDRTPLPKLSAAVPVPLPQIKKKEKKKKKEKTMKSSKKMKETLTPIPKLTFKTSNKKVSIVKPSKLPDRNTVSKKTEENTKSSSSSMERKVITETISVGSTVGVIYDAEGNRVWICPGCNKPDDGSPMIGCDGCDGWYHWPCVNIKREPENDEWYCPKCRVGKKSR